MALVGYDVLMATRLSTAERGLVGVWELQTSVSGRPYTVIAISIQGDRTLEEMIVGGRGCGVPSLFSWRWNVRGSVLTFDRTEGWISKIPAWLDLGWMGLQRGPLKRMRLVTNGPDEFTLIQDDGDSLTYRRCADRLHEGE
jgi:hypothetical protein